MTEYMVFAKFLNDEDTTIEGDDGNHFMWQYMSRVEARSARAAIQLVAEQTAEQDLKDVEFAATPASLWNPMSVTAETKRVVKIG